jgi:hypothetical protein
MFENVSHFFIFICRLMDYVAHILTSLPSAKKWANFNNKTLTLIHADFVDMRLDFCLREQ